MLSSSFFGSGVRRAQSSKVDQSKSRMVKGKLRSLVSLELREGPCHERTTFHEPAS